MEKTFAPFQATTTGMKMLYWSGTMGFLYAAWAAYHRHNLIIPLPGEVWTAFQRMLHEDLIEQLWRSFSLNVQALFWSTLISCGLAYLYVLPVFRPFVTLVCKMRFLGFSGITTLFAMATEGRTFQIALLTFGMSAFYVTSMVDVVRAIPPEEINHARSVHLGPLGIIWHVAIRGTLHQMLDVMRQTSAMGWVMLAFAEGLVLSQGGVGVMLINLGRRWDLAAIFAVQISIMLVGMAWDFVQALLREIACQGFPQKEE